MIRWLWALLRETPRRADGEIPSGYIPLVLRATPEQRRRFRRTWKPTPRPLGAKRRDEDA